MLCWKISDFNFAACPAALQCLSSAKLGAFGGENQNMAGNLPRPKSNILNPVMAGCSRVAVKIREEAEKGCGAVGRQWESKELR